MARLLRDGDLSAAPAALNLLESSAPEQRAEAATLMAALSPRALGHEPRGHIVGVTGPPGAGKSTLLAALIRHLRRYGYGSAAEPAAPITSQALIAVDPSSRRSGGALLGDRLRIALERPDPAIFIRSSAAGERHGGLASGTRAAAEALAVAFDVVIVETVGVGQAETEIADVADTVMVVVQPGSGDVLQFLKAGIMEIPDVLVVTKGDMEPAARRTQRELRAALGALGGPGPGETAEQRIVTVSSVPPPAGFDGLAALLGARWQALRADGGAQLSARRLQMRRSGALTDFVAEHGQRGLRALGGRRAAERILAGEDPTLSVAELVAGLERHAARTG
ncbi:MAG: ArgK protein [Acidobacteriota bacterium]|nr:ArgK protein [Acidobacteriota bacterium]